MAIKSYAQARMAIDAHKMIRSAAPEPLWRKSFRKWQCTAGVFDCDVTVELTPTLSIRIFKRGTRELLLETPLDQKRLCHESTKPNS